MRAITYLRLSLLLPIALWLVMLLMFLVATGVDGLVPEFLVMVPAMYVFGIIFWLVPYALLAVGLLVWSNRRPRRTVLRVFALAPLMLTALILLEINLLSIAFEDPATVLAPSSLQDLAGLNLLAVGLTLGAGYGCVALAFGIYTLLQRLNVIQEHEAPVETARMVEAGGNGQGGLPRTI